MYGLRQLRNTIFISSCIVLLWSSLASAQVKGDGTANTLVTTNGNTFAINGGTQVEKNLFHSFTEFSLPAKTEAFFNNLPIIDNIITRVTGGSISNIDGLIRANGSASLFLINPNGIVFGPNASLNLGGSFFASTADSIVFTDGSIFSATHPQAPSLLAVNIPIGLQFRSNPGRISVQSSGHNVTAPKVVFGELPSPFTLNTKTGLQVQSGQTLALVGGDVSLEGGLLKAESGRIELGSVGSGRVNLHQTPQGTRLDYSNVTGFQNVSLSQKALADVSGFGGGSIQVQGANVSLTDGSLLYIQHQGTQAGESISVNATESLQLIGSTLSRTGLVPSALLNQTIKDGNGGEMRISTQRLLLQQGGAINALSFENARGSNIIVDATESVQLLGSLGTQSESRIFSETYGFGKAGNITVSTKDLMAVDGGAILSRTQGSGSSGDVSVTAVESIKVIGVVLDSSFTPLLSTISTVTGGLGWAGTLTINTRRLAVRGGASIIVSTFAQGDAGTLTINATESVELSGVASSNFVARFSPSALSSAALLLLKDSRDFLGLPDEPSGATGSVTVITPRLTITDGATINISHPGSQGNAGNLEINASSVFLDNQSDIRATTRTGKGGNITLNVRDTLLLRDSSFISATAGGTGNGGNIDINTNFLIAFPNENSDITANAFGGQGGAINITATGVFGLAIRDQLTLDNDITAFSQLEPALNGIITLNTPEIDPSRGLIELPETVINPNTLVAQNPCRKGTQSELTITGRGGLPPNPTDDLNPQATQVNLVEPASTVQTERKQKDSSNPSSRQNPIVPAQGWIYNAKGEIVLTAYNPSVTESQRLQTNPVGCPTP